MSEHPGEARILAGGADLIHRLKQQIIRPTLILDLSDIRNYGFAHSDASRMTVVADE